MTITQMIYFVTVCEYGTISKSAEFLHISQPSISLAIRNLEEEFGVTLFDRENKRFQLSQEGKFMYDSVKDILAQISTLEVQMTNLGKHLSQLCVSVPILTGKFLLDFFMNNFHKKHPDIHFIIRQYNSPKAFQSLEDGSCDVAIIVDQDKLPSGLDRKPIFTSEFVFCVNPNNELAKRDSVNIIDLKKESIIFSQENSYMAKKLKKEFYKVNAVPDIMMYGVQLPLIRSMIASEQASTFLIKELADTWPEVVSIPLKEKIPITFSLVWRKDKFLNKKNRILIEYILSSFNSSSDTL